MQVPVFNIMVIIILCGCNPSENGHNTSQSQTPIVGTWRLLKGSLIQNGDTTVTDYTQNKSFIKIINATHFAFLQHKTGKRKDSSEFSAGGGTYSIHDSNYIEHLEYCSSPEWEGGDFKFIVAFSGDTLIQKGIERLPNSALTRMNIETYVKWKTVLKGDTIIK